MRGAWRLALNKPCGWLDGPKWGFACFQTINGLNKGRREEKSVVFFAGAEMDILNFDGLWWTVMDCCGLLSGKNRFKMMENLVVNVLSYV